MPVRPSYLKYSFPLPKKRFVGLLACQRDPLLSTLETEVIKCEKRIREAVAVPKKGKKTAAEAVAPVEDEWEVQLLDTVLFPEGGGQPSDRGTMKILGADGDVSPSEPVVKVREILRKGLDAVHFCDRSVEVGQKVLVELDAEYRRDLMSQHTGQHVLSGVIDRLYPEMETLSWSLTPAPQSCYIELPRTPTAEEIAIIQERCNEIIRANALVSVEMSLPGDKVVDHKIPEDYQGAAGEQGVIRVVDIEGLDPNPCCGTHYPSLSHLQSIFILPQPTSIRSTNSRLHFLVGPRVLQYLSTTHSLVRESSLEIGCAVPDLSERVGLLQSGAKETMRREKKLREEVAGFVARELLRDAKGKEGVLKGVNVREEDATNSLEFLTGVAGVIKTELESQGAKTPYIFILAACSSVGTPVASSSGSLMIFGTEELVAKAGKEVTEALKGKVKGGGKGRWQGKLAVGRWEKADKEVFEKILEGVVV